MIKWLIILIMAIGMVEIVNALCWNPLELFCIFDEKENTYLDTRDNSTTSISSSSSISVNKFTTGQAKILNYDDNSPIKVSREGETFYANYNPIDLNETKPCSYYYSFHSK